MAAFLDHNELYSFFVVHIVQVVLAGWNNFRAMVSGQEIQQTDSPSIEEARRSRR